MHHRHRDSQPHVGACHHRIDTDDMTVHIDERSTSVSRAQMQTGVNPLTLIMWRLWRRSDADDDAGSDCPGHTPRMSQR